MPHSVGHEVRVDRANLLIDVTLRGSLSPEDLGWIGEEVRAVIRTFGPDAGKHRTLYDVTGITVLPQASAQAVIDSFAHPSVRPLWARKLAYVVTTTLIRRQLRRLAEVRPDLRIFEDRDAALAWLLED